MKYRLGAAGVNRHPTPPLSCLWSNIAAGAGLISMVNRHRRPSTQAIILIYRLNWCADAKNYIELNWAFDFNSISERRVY